MTGFERSVDIHTVVRCWLVAQDCRICIETVLHSLELIWPWILAGAWLH